MMLEFYGTRMRRIRYREDADETDFNYFSFLLSFRLKGEITRGIPQSLSPIFVELLVRFLPSVEMTIIMVVFV
ncbi:hypothetical protein AAFH68_05950 [Flavobacterium sp. CGRL1]